MKLLNHLMPDGTSRLVSIPRNECRADCGEYCQDNDSPFCGGEICINRGS